MALKVSQLFIFSVCILFLLLSPLPSVRSEGPNGIIQSPFEFLKNLQGSKKGDTQLGLENFKNYLKRFGYLNYDHLENQQNANNNNYFVNLLEAAIKTYQLNYHLNQTGTLDPQTVSKMVTPRCGVPDIVNGITNMRSRSESPSHGHRSLYFHAKAHYNFFIFNPKWPTSKTQLTYAFVNSTLPGILTTRIAKAFDRWANVTKHFTFVQMQDYTNSDIKIGFYNGYHGDDIPFDGPGGILAHSSIPPLGIFHLDAAEWWCIVGLQPECADLYTVALHEIGHLLGLAHSSDVNAIMYPTLPFGVAKEIGLDDIQGIKALYNLSNVV